MAEQVWLAYFAERGPEGWEKVQGVFTTEALARACCEKQVADSAARAEEYAAEDPAWPPFLTFANEMAQNAQKYRAATWQFNAAYKVWELVPGVFESDVWFVTAMPVQDRLTAPVLVAEPTSPDCSHELTRLPMRDTSTGVYHCACCTRLVFGDEAHCFCDDGGSAYCWNCCSGAPHRGTVYSDPEE